MNNSSRLAGGASRRAGNSLRADRSAPGCLTWTRSSSWPEDLLERFEVLALSAGAPFEGVAEEPLLLPLAEREDLLDDAVALLEEDESSDA